MSGTGKITQIIPRSNDSAIDGLLYDEAWVGTITYSFPTSSAFYNYFSTFFPGESFNVVSPQQQNAARFALDTEDGNVANDGFSVEGFTNLNVSAGSAATSNIRFAESSVASPTAFAFLPGRGDPSGDVWFGTSYNFSNPQAGNYAWATHLHEIGHALGLKHPHETDIYGALPIGLDSMEYSIMSYRAYTGAPLTGYTNETNGFAQTFMMGDIAALQYMYGADFTTNSGDTVYSWTPGSGDTLVNGVVAIDASANRIFATIWDGGGNDTYDLSAYTTGVSVNLAPGESSLFSATQQANLGNGNYASGNIYNALLYQGDLRSLIENAIGGSGNDILSGNQVNNVLTGNGGNDSLIGLGGQDTLYGGGGVDTLEGGDGGDFLFGGGGNDSLYGGSSTDQLFGGGGADLMDGGDGTDIHFVDAFDIVTDTGTVGYDRAQINDAGGVNLNLTGWSGIERVNGFTGNDTIDASSQNVTLLLFGDAGADVITGGSVGDIILGGAGDDTLIGGGGNDTMQGGTGNDVFYGGDGNDLFYIGETLDFVGNGGAGFDRAVINDAAGVSIAIGGWVGVERINGFTGNDTIDATGLTTGIIMAGGDGADVLTGGAAGDTFYAGTGNDSVNGAGGADALIGSAGNDTLNGGAGNDFLLGGADADVFVFETGFGKDVVKDYTDGVDLIDFSGLGSVTDMGDLIITQSGANTIISLASGGDDVITLADVTATDLDASDFLFV